MELRFLALAAFALPAVGSALACESVPDVSFASADGAVDATTGDAAPASDSAPMDDAGTGDDGASEGGADANIPCSVIPGVDAGCCPMSGTLCVGVACSHCLECGAKSCKTTEYCCATLNNGNQFKNVTCQQDPRAMCP